MSAAAGRTRTAYIHVGTHKTGTSSLQAMLASNEAAFREAGVFVPHTGKLAPNLVGHHNIAWELRQDPRFDPSLGTLELLQLEISKARSPVICLTSEDFEFLSADEPALRRLRDSLIATGCQPRIIIFLRPQVDYVESLYAEIIKTHDVAFTAYLDAVLKSKSCGPFVFEYDRLVGAFANVFGKEHTIVRPYHFSDSAHLLQEFITIVAPSPMDLSRLPLPQRLNTRACYPDVIATRAQQLGRTVQFEMPAKRPFDPLNLLDIARIVLRFSRSNERLARAFGIRIGCVTAARLAREVLTALVRDHGSTHGKRLIRDLIQTEA